MSALFRSFPWALLLCTLGLVAAAHAAEAPVVAVTGGKAEGRLLPAGGAVFKGLPFAQPPAGNLRWREPQPVKAWTGVRQAAEFGAACPQSDSGWNKLAADKSSEDCLYLNVWTPQWPASARLPVMVWVHGGGNTGGSAMGAGGIEPPFDAASLARHGVVVVTVNYRLGLFGFLGHPELTAESPHHASGGYGLLDQVAALQWVRANIARFGGDPGNVTLFGQSAGAQNTSILVASPLIKGLINKAIAESGTPMIGDKRLQTPVQTEQLGVILAGALHAPASGAIKYLRGLSAQQILAATPDFRKGLNDQHLIFDVGMDGYAVPRFAPEVYRSGKEAPVPMIIGSNGRDSPGQRSATGTEEEIRAAVKGRIDTFYASYPDLAGRAQLAYGVSGGKSAPGYAPYGPLDLQLGVDNGFRCEAVALAGWHSKVAPTWEYEFTAGNAAHPPAHSAELDFVFGYLRDQAEDPKLSQLSQQMQTYWTNFARTGDPNGPGLPQWAKYEVGKKSYLEFYNDGPLAKADLRGPQCSLYVEKLTRDLGKREP
jgi:para-nitrobenzyl esterase